MHGAGVLIYANKTYEGYFINNKPEGKGRLTVPGQYTVECYFKGGKTEGEGKIFYKRGSVYKGLIKKEKPHGIGK